MDACKTHQVFDERRTVHGADQRRPGARVLWSDFQCLTGAGGGFFTVGPGAVIVQLGGNYPDPGIIGIDRTLSDQIIRVAVKGEIVHAAFQSVFSIRFSSSSSEKPNSSSIVTPKSVAMEGKKRVSGRTAPCSHPETICVLTPRTSAISSGEMDFLSLNRYICFPKFIW